MRRISSCCLVVLASPGDCLRWRGQLVTKAELVAEVWPNAVVDAGNLKVQISALRKVLGREHVLTETGHGYRFVTPIGCREARRDGSAR